MPTKRELLTYQTRLRADEDEREILGRVQESFAAIGIEVSLNEVIRHLIRRAEIPIPANADEARDAMFAHWAACDACHGERKPKCPDGALHRREWQRHLGLRDGRSYALQPVQSRDLHADEQKAS